MITRFWTECQVPWSIVRWETELEESLSVDGSRIINLLEGVENGNTHSLLKIYRSLIRSKIEYEMIPHSFARHIYQNWRLSRKWQWVLSPGYSQQHRYKADIVYEEKCHYLTDLLCPNHAVNISILSYHSRSTITWNCFLIKYQSDNIITSAFNVRLIQLLEKYEISFAKHFHI